MGAVFMALVLGVCALTSLAMLVAAIRYLLLDEARKAAFRSDPAKSIGLSRGEETLRGLAVLGVVSGLFSMPWWPKRGTDLLVVSTDVAGLISWGALSWLAVAAVLLRRLIYKRWV